MAEHSNAAGGARFRDYVKELPHQWIFDNLIGGVGARRILSSAMIKDAVAKFASGAALSERFKDLIPEMRLRCAQAYLTGGNGLGLADPAAYAKEPLLASLLVFAAQNGAGLSGVRLFGFDEFEPVLRPMMAEALAEAGTAAGDGRQAFPQAQTAQFCPWRPLNDIAAACALAMHGQLRRSVHGGLSRSALHALKKLTCDPTLTGKSVSEGVPGHPAGFLIGFCLSEGLLLGGDSEYRPNRPALAAWLEAGMKERLRKLTAYAAEFLEGFGIALMHELLKRANGRWLYVNAIVPEADRPLLARALDVFEFLGCVQTGRGSASAGMKFAYVKSTAGENADVDEIYAREHRRETLVMSDFNVVIPQEAAPDEIFDFSKIGLLAAFDKVYRGQITKESVSNALSAGVDPSYLRLWLRERRAPANVAKTADEWIREFSRLFVSRGPMLVSSDEKVTKQIASLEPLRKHLTEVPAHAVFAIRPESFERVSGILNKLGFDTRGPGIEQAAGGAERAEDLEIEEEEGAPTALSDKKRWEPLTDFSLAPADAQPAAPMSRTKYGSGLKALEISEMIHVIDYAILTNQALVVDYAGSANVGQSIYTAVPVSVDKGLDAAVEADIRNGGGRKLLYLDKINRIGVVSL